MGEVVNERGDFYVYAWLRPCGTPFYVGKGRGSRDVNKQGRNKIFRRIVDKIERSGSATSVVRILANLTEEEAFALERSEIAKHGRLTNKTGVLANMTDGGEGTSGRSQSNEAKEKLRVANTGKTVSLETRAKLSAANIGKLLSEQARLKMILATSGVPKSEGARVNMSKAQRLSKPHAGYKGVSQHGSTGKWIARITHDGVSQYLGSFISDVDAARAYDAAAIDYWGSGNCFVNFPDRTESIRPQAQSRSDTIRLLPSSRGLKGAYLNHAGRWFSQIKISGVVRYLGSFGTDEDAARAYDAAAYAAWGNKCYLNFPIEDVS